MVVVVVVVRVLGAAGDGRVVRLGGFIGGPGGGGRVQSSLALGGKMGRVLKTHFLDNCAVVTSLTSSTLTLPARPRHTFLTCYAIVQILTAPPVKRVSRHHERDFTQHSCTCLIFFPGCRQQN